MTSKIEPVSRNMLYQTGTIRSLFKGVYDGDISFAELAHYGDFGLGTFDKVSGEMVAFDGHFYRIDSSGKASPAHSEARTPFSVITRFQAAQGFSMQDVDTFKTMQSVLEDTFESRNLMYAIRIDGLFSGMRVRSVHHQRKPYKPLTETLGGLQTEFLHQEIAGTLVGIWFPEYMSSINAPGFHFHFLDENRLVGGHVFELAVKKAQVQINKIYDFGMHLIHTKLFELIDLSKEDDDAIHKLEDPSSS